MEGDPETEGEKERRKMRWKKDLSRNWRVMEGEAGSEEKTAGRRNEEGNSTNQGNGGGSSSIHHFIELKENRFSWIRLPMI